MPLSNNLGAVFENDMTKFSVYSENAQKIELCLFSSDETIETKIPLTKDENNIWSANIESIKPGQKYGYRAHGEYNPEKGLFFNPNKLLVDPYAKELSKTIDDWNNPALLHNDLDSAQVVPKSIVIFDNKTEDAKKYPYLYKKPQIAWKDTILYEAHVRGLSIDNLNLPENVRGKFAALAQPEMIDYLKDLGITHLELMPVTPTCGGKQLKQENGLVDYWGYNPINHFALDPRYGSREDFKSMVSKLHEAGIEVGLDLVYNHTGEFDAQGDKANTISYKGLDSPSYYRMGEDKANYINTTGCGNSFNTNTAPAQKIVESSLHYFAETLGVDGFRFDLGGDCALDENHQFNADNTFMNTIRKVSEDLNVKVSGEAWSAVGGYYHGQMKGMMEWNDKYETTIRRFFRGDKGVVPELASQVSGSEGLYHGQNQCKYVHYVAVHDGFTAMDVVKYNQKDNSLIKGDEHSGCDDNHSAASPNEEIARRRLESMLATTILSRGIPLILAGDEYGRSKDGCNNSYCLDKFWHKWKDLTKEEKDTYLFTRKVLALRKKHPIFANLDNFSGNFVAETGRKDIEWIKPDGKEMEHQDWNCDYARTLAYVLNGQGGKVSPNSDSKNNVDDDFLVIHSGNVDGNVAFNLPKPPNGSNWQLVFDTGNQNKNLDKKFAENEVFEINPYAVAVFTCKRPVQDEKILDMQQAVLQYRNNTR